MMEPTFGDRVFRLRNMIEGLSLRELSRLARLTESHCGQLESGRVGRVAAHTVMRLAEVFGTSMDWLYSGVGKAPDAPRVEAAVARARKRLAATD